MTIAAGSRLGPYEVLGLVGAGGMGEVYRARDPRLGREVAIKVLPSSVSQDADRLRRFEQEARAASALNHPNILAIYDVGSHDGAPYVVSELLEGETLRERLSGSALTARKAMDCGIQIAEGLAAAHEKGIVHRDLKPENLFVTKDGRVKILDFGLAKLTRSEAPSGPQTGAPTVPAGTEPGIVLGTVGYMSPEQVRGQAADHRSDIFAFGSILYEMLAGRRAFGGGSAVETMSAILKEEPRFEPTQPDASPALEHIVRRCLEKSPGERFQSARDLAFALNTLSVPAVPHVSPRVSVRWRRVARWAAAGLGVILLVLLSYGRGRKPIDSLAVLPFANASADPETEYLSDGITESLINSLSQLPELRVISRASVFRYKGKDQDPGTVARELGVRTVVTGRVTQRGDMLSIGAELVDTRGNRQLWGERYDRKFADVLTLQRSRSRSRRTCGCA